MVPKKNLPISLKDEHVTRTYEDRLSDYLVVSSSTGVIVIRGPGRERPS
jgi:hypothetical protein